MTRLSTADLDDIKARNPLADIAGGYVKLRRMGKRLVGPCPICGGKVTSQRFEILEDGESWVCAVCPDGGDVIHLVQKVEGCDFKAAIERLGGQREIDKLAAKKLFEAREKKRLEREKKSDDFREAERKRLWRPGSTPARSTARWPRVTSRAAAWCCRRRARGCGSYPRRHTSTASSSTSAAANRPSSCTRARRCSPPSSAPTASSAGCTPPGSTSLRHLMTCAARQDRTQRSGNRRTAQRQENARLQGRRPHRDRADQRPAAPDRRRGDRDRAGRLDRLPPAPAARLEDTAFWAAGDLGNMAGRSAKTVPHPTLKRPNGRAISVPNDQPDPDDPGLSIPDSVDELMLLGDGDSEPVLTRFAMIRAARRYARPGRVTIRIAFAPAGVDFNDVLRGAA
jgi:hypothetical protein